mmetsp:Transcript_19076/g.38554  ORF Transcript_19076/g.38554 Transcript_19076/m.38554 type:complete len:461 (-) Transcript_19076:14-1396(-)
MAWPPKFLRKRQRRAYSAAERTAVGTADRVVSSLPSARFRRNPSAGRFSSAASTPPPALMWAAMSVITGTMVMPVATRMAWFRGRPSISRATSSRASAFTGAGIPSGLAAMARSVRQRSFGADTRWLGVSRLPRTVRVALRMLSFLSERTSRVADPARRPPPWSKGMSRATHFPSTKRFWFDELFSNRVPSSFKLSTTMMPPIRYPSASAMPSTLSKTPLKATIFWMVGLRSMRCCMSSRASLRTISPDVSRRATRLLTAMGFDRITCCARSFFPESTFERSCTVCSCTYGSFSPTNSISKNTCSGTEANAVRLSRHAFVSLGSPPVGCLVTFTSSWRHGRTKGPWVLAAVALGSRSRLTRETIFTMAGLPSGRYGYWLERSTKPSTALSSCEASVALFSVMTSCVHALLDTLPSSVLVLARKESTNLVTCILSWGCYTLRNPRALSDDARRGGNCREGP